MNGLVHHNSHDKDENGVTMAMQRITLMVPRYAGRIWHLNTQIPGACGGNPVHTVFYRH